MVDFFGRAGDVTCSEDAADVDGPPATVNADLLFFSGTAEDVVVVACRLPAVFCFSVGGGAPSGGSFLLRGTRTVGDGAAGDVIAGATLLVAAGASDFLIRVINAGTGPGGRIITEAERSPVAACCRVISCMCLTFAA